MIIEKLHHILLGNDLGLRLSPQGHAAGVIAVTMSNNNRVHGIITYRGQQLLMLWCHGWQGSVDNDVTFVGNHHKGITKAAGLVDNVVYFFRDQLITALLKM